MATAPAPTGAFIRPLKPDLDDVAQSLMPERVTRDSLPDFLKREWIAGTAAGALKYRFALQSDMLVTLIPLIAAGLVTLEICALTKFKLKYANTIALPVLLAVGVAL
jgi:hypothetical protein